MDFEKLSIVAQQMVEKGKGILAADESSGTIEKRFTKIGLASTEENRRAYREMIITTPGLGDHISGFDRLAFFNQHVRAYRQPVNSE